MYSLWQCTSCGFSSDVDPQHGPVRCICGIVDHEPNKHLVNDAQRLLPRVRNYAVAFRGWAHAGYPSASDKDVARRFDQCRRCDLFNGEICLHINCGCNIRVDDSDGKLVKLAGLLGIKSLTERAKAMTNKLRMATESCPIGKWGPIETTSEPRRPP